MVFSDFGLARDKPDVGSCAGAARHTYCEDGMRAGFDVFDGIRAVLRVCLHHAERPFAKKLGENRFVQCGYRIEAAEYK